MPGEERCEHEHEDHGQCTRRWMHDGPHAYAAAKPEMVEHPAHYGGAENPYEVIKVLKAWGLEDDALLWNAVKYIARHRSKGHPEQDLKKAAFYLNRRIAEGMPK